MVSRNRSRSAYGTSISHCPVCNKELATISIEVDGNELIMESCDQCDTRTWHLAGKPVKLSDALTEVKAHVGKSL